MNILLIGHSIVDHIEKNGDQITKAGGIFYSTVGMLLIKNRNDKIYLLTALSKNNYYLFEKIYSKVCLDYVTETDNMPEVYLKDYHDRERDEFYKNISSPLSLEKIEDLSKFDGILINMITGFDITIEQLKFIRNNFNGKIYFDVHTLSRGIDQNMKREFRQIKDIENWLSNIDILQCNQNELMTIFDYDNENERINRILSYSANILVLTKGSNGAELYYKENNKVKNYVVPAERVEVKNRIGCGDIFGAVFFYSYLRSKNLVESLNEANKFASLAVSKNILDEL
ncbi:MAG: carbohydrate kinase family protein [Melioribacter sp.]|nr:carbohydrate kinase family protein [Melioribacter sp.]